MLLKMGFQRTKEKKAERKKAFKNARGASGLFQFVSVSLLLLTPLLGAGILPPLSFMACSFPPPSPSMESGFLFLFQANLSHAGLLGRQALCCAGWASPLVTSACCAGAVPWAGQAQGNAWVGVLALLRLLEASHSRSSSCWLLLPCPGGMRRLQDSPLLLLSVKCCKTWALISQSKVSVCSSLCGFNACEYIFGSLMVGFKILKLTVVLQSLGK